MLATTLLFAIDGHLLLVRGFLTSFDAAPLTSLSVDTMAELLTGDIAPVLRLRPGDRRAAAGRAVPGRGGAGLLARAAPQMNVFQLGLPVKILVTLTLAGLALPLLPDAVSGITNQVVRQGLDVVGADG